MKINIPCEKCGTRIWSEYTQFIESYKNFFTPTLCEPCQEKRKERIRQEEIQRRQQLNQKQVEDRARMKRAYYNTLSTKESHERETQDA